MKLSGWHACFEGMQVVESAAVTFMLINMILYAHFGKGCATQASGTRSVEHYSIETPTYQPITVCATNSELVGCAKTRKAPEELEASGGGQHLIMSALGS